MLDMSPHDTLVPANRVAGCLHALAAMNHRQWTLWEAVVLPTLDEYREQPDQARSLLLESPKLEEMLSGNAQVAINLVGSAIGMYMYQPKLETVINRKREQLHRWIEYAVANFLYREERWQRQTRTPFLELPREEQASDYNQAVRDLLVIARAGGRNLPNPLPEVDPYGDKRLKWVRMSHRLGRHGLFLVSERSWSYTCQGCHADIVHD